MDRRPPPRVSELPWEGVWQNWRGPVAQAEAPDGNWRSLPHLHSVEVCGELLRPRVQELNQLLEANGCNPLALECRICRHAGGLGACLAQDSGLGVRHHLRRLWSMALSVGPGPYADLWEEVPVAGGVVRFNYVHGAVELCRGAPPTPEPERAAGAASGTGGAVAALSAAEAATSGRSARRSATSARRGRGEGQVSIAAPEAPQAEAKKAGRGRRRRSKTSRAAAASSRRSDGSTSPTAQRRPAAPPRGAPASAGSQASETRPPSASAPPSPPTSGPPRRPRPPGAWKAEAGVGAEAEDEEREERVVLDARPLGLEIGPQHGGRGAVVRQSEGQAAAAGVEPGSTILCINEHSVEDMATADIQGMLDGEQLPLTLDIRPPLETMTVRRRKPKKRDPVTVLTAGCRGSYRVVSEAVEHLGWMELPSLKEAMSRVCSVVWLEHADPTEGIAPVQTVSRLEAFLHFCKKARLAKSLNAWCEALPEEFAFSPQTWVVPYDAAELRTAMGKAKKDEAFIVKPTAGAQGKGITLARKWRDVENLVSRAKASMENANKATMEYVVQRYVTQPCLLDGLKFDLRLYVVVTSVVPMRAYLFKEGLARFCTVPYEPPQDGNLREARMHLTNFAVNKKSKDFQPSEGLAGHDEGSKRSVSATLRQIELAYGVGPEEVWGKVSSLIANTLTALRPALVEYYVHESPRPLHPLAPKGFQLIGLDVMIDAEIEPKLIELNANPSLSAVQPDMKAQASEAAADASPSASAEGPAPFPRPPSAGLGASGGLLPPAHAPSALPVVAPVLGGAQAMPLLASGGASGPLVGPGRGLPAQSMAVIARNPRRSRSTANIVPQPQRPREEGQASAPGPVRRAGSAEPPGASAAPAAGSGRRALRRHQSRSRREEGKREPSAGPAPTVTSELDLEIKRELVIQALLLAKPAPQNKATRLKKQWKPRSSGELLPLSDTGAWALGGKPTRAEAPRPDAPERCPALEEIDFEALAAPEVYEYAKAHLAIYRWWSRMCGTGRESLGQAQVQRLLERGGLVGDSAGALFGDRVSAQLWLSKAFREIAPGSFGLNLPQLVALFARLGGMLSSRASAADAEDGQSARSSAVGDVLAFARLGLIGEI